MTTIRTDEEQVAAVAELLGAVLAILPDSIRSAARMEMLPALASGRCPSVAALDKIARLAEALAIRRKSEAGIGRLNRGRSASASRQWERLLQIKDDVRRDHPAHSENALNEITATRATEEFPPEYTKDGARRRISPARVRRAEKALGKKT